MLLGYDIRGDMLWPTHVMEPGAAHLGTDRAASLCHWESLLMSTEPWVSVEDAAKHLSVAKDSIYRWIEHKALPAHKVGRLWKFKLSEVDAWVRAGGAGSEGPDNRGRGPQG